MGQSPSPLPLRPQDPGALTEPPRGCRRATGARRPGAWAPAWLPAVSVWGRPAWRGSWVAAGRTAVCWALS